MAAERGSCQNIWSAAFSRHCFSLLAGVRKASRKRSLRDLKQLSQPASRMGRPSLHRARKNGKRTGCKFLSVCMHCQLCPFLGFLQGLTFQRGDCHGRITNWLQEQARLGSAEGGLLVILFAAGFCRFFRNSAGKRGVAQRPWPERGSPVATCSSRDANLPVPGSVTTPQSSALLSDCFSDQRKLNQRAVRANNTAPVRRDSLGSVLLSEPARWLWSRKEKRRLARRRCPPAHVNTSLLIFRRSEPVSPFALPRKAKTGEDITGT